MAPPPNLDYSCTFVHLVSAMLGPTIGYDVSVRLQTDNLVSAMLGPTIGYDVSVRLQTDNVTINCYTTFFVSCHYHGKIIFLQSIVYE